MSGAVASGWHEVPVRKIASIITGPFGTLLKASEYGGPDGVPVISVGEIRDGFLRVTDETPRVEAEVTGRLPQYLLKEGDIVFGRKGGVERSARVLPEHVGWFLGSDGISIRVKDGLNSIFFGHAMRSKQVQGWLLQNASGTTMPSLNQAILGSAVIRYPDDPDEQQAIAAALSDADGVVAGLERVIAKKRLIKQGAMQDLLTARRRLPGFSGEWEEVQLKDYTSHGSGNSGLIKGTLQRSGRVGDYPAFTASGPDLMLDFFEQEGDAIIISAVGSRCGKSFRARGKWSAIANTHVLRCREGLDVDFAFIFMNDEDFWLKGGTGQPFVLVRRTLERPLLLPPVNEQQAIASVLRDMDAEIQTLESRLAKARAVKEGMMQNLLTGRVRLV